MKTLLFLCVSVLFLISCQRKAALGLAADPMSSIAAPPMGATTYNDELKKELSLLDDLVNNRIDQKKLSAVIKALMDGSKELLSPNYEHAALVKLFLTLPELVHPKEKLTDNRKLWFKAKLLFLKRRFVEASITLSEVLKNEPTFVEARNWRARAIFFLGNPDLAISELKLIIKTSPAESEASLDAHYLIGAIVYESNDLDKERIKTGIDAWKKYLSHKESTPELKKEISDSLAELGRRLEGKPEAPPILDPFSPHERNGPAKNAILEAFAEDKLLRAEELAGKALLKGYDPVIAIVKARTFFKSGRLDEAVELFNQIVEKSPNYAPAFHYRGMAFMMKGQIKEALLSWKKTLALDKAYGEAHNLQQRISVAEKMVEPTKVEMH